MCFTTDKKIRLENGAMQSFAPVSGSKPDPESIGHGRIVNKKIDFFFCMEIEIDEDGKPIDMDISSALLGAFSDSKAESFEDSNGVKHSVKKGKAQDLQQILTEKNREVGFQKNLIGLYKTEVENFVAESATRKIEMHSLVSSEAAKSVETARNWHMKATVAVSALKKQNLANTTNPCRKPFCHSSISCDAAEG